MLENVSKSPVLGTQSLLALISRGLLTKCGEKVEGNCFDIFLSRCLNFNLNFNFTVWILCVGSLFLFLPEAIQAMFKK